MLLTACLAGQAPESARGQTRNPHGPLKQACETCHATAAWKPLRANIEFDHNRDTAYPLRGMHHNVDCARCHVNKVFADVGKTCANCHADFHRRQMGGQCEDCHTVRGWKLTTQADAKAHLNRFPLVGAHAAVNCESCHRGAASGVFKGLNTECVTCHLNIYENSVTVNHRRAGFTTNCESCHSLDTWRKAKFNHESFTGYALTGRHTTLECNSCHNTLQYKGTSANCFSCHSTDFNAAKIPNHAASNFPRDCSFCHSTQAWQGAKFDHNTTTKFALTGAHASIGNCASCHAAGRFTGTPMNCSGCHLPDFEKTTNPNHSRGRFSSACEDCHTTTQWKDAKFDHNLARFQLSGAHARVDCAQCHIGGKWTGTTSECADCHRTDFSKPLNPSHTAGGFPQNCTMCHTTAQWSGASFNHNTSTKFALTGKHTATMCSQCHLNDKFAGTGQECISCHLDGFKAATNPNHVSGAFPTECTMCHTTATWSAVTFRHDTSTRFALTGKHSALTCQQCHSSGQFSGTPMQCIGCHRAEFQKTAQPNHLAARFAEDCASCHTTAQWMGAKFDHTASTKFALTGKHTAVNCQQCHVNDKFAGLGQECARCHMDAFHKTKTPNHAAAAFSSSCQNCHTTAQWSGATFDHSTSTKFPLTGKHAAVSCAQCHANDKFAGMAQDCLSCHRDELEKTVNPNHVKAGFPTNCTMCHTTVQWKGAKFDHNTGTKFPLTGKHTALTCQQCHVNERYAGLGQDCATCHLDEYRNAKTPNHTAAGFATACQTCHSTLQWKGGSFDHTKTRFPLTGKHIVTTCLQCHVNDRFSGTAQACIGCHQADFRKPTNNPNHVTAGIPEDCALCHTTVQWKGARFDHNTATKYPLTGRHVSTSCMQCHLGNKFKGTAQDCASCHLTEFRNTKNPNHTAARFATTCQTCHNTSFWADGLFDHNRSKFPLTGKHTSVSCKTCHVNDQYTGIATACIGCHRTDFQKPSNNPNHVTAGFPEDCTLCHTSIQWRGAKFDHSVNTKFPLTGKHTTTACMQCHAGNVFKNLAQDCATCHLKQFQSAKNPNHASAAFSTKCETCHTTARWQGATFDHSKTKFPLTGRHTATACAQCHVNNQFSGIANDCASCHLPAYNATVNPNHKAAGFPTNCTMCHTTGQWKGAVFDHSSTRFALTGKHNTVACQQCHLNNKFAGTAQDCASCHLPRFQNTVNPNHVASGFPTTCQTCHTTAQWSGARFDHNAATKYALTGKHTGAGCQQCHVNNKFAGTPQDCATCHSNTYNSTTSPNHRNAGFSTACQTCHTTTQWKGAQFDHSKTKFPLTGKHTATTCAQCHVNGQYAGTATQCSNCHLRRSTPQRTRTIRTPVSPPIALSATPPRSGRAPRSHTPSSRLQGNTPPCSARSAIRTAST